VVAVAVELDAVAQPFAAQSTDEVVGIVDEKHGVLDGVFLAELGEKFPSNRDRIRRKQPRVRDSVRFRVDGGVQPVLLVGDADHLLTDRNAIRAVTACRLEVSLLHPAVNRCPTPTDTQPIGKNNCIRK